MSNSYQKRFWCIKVRLTNYYNIFIFCINITFFFFFCQWMLLEAWNFFYIVETLRNFCIEIYNYLHVCIYISIEKFFFWSWPNISVCECVLCLDLGYMGNTSHCTNTIVDLVGKDFESSTLVLGRSNELSINNPVCFGV